MKYPEESYHIWLVLQKVIYNIETKWDKKISLVEAVISDIGEI